MLTVTSCPLELRGIANQKSKAGNVFYVLNCESDDGSPHALYCPKVDALPAGLKKGDMIRVTFSVHTYNRNERLVVERVVLAK